MNRWNLNHETRRANAMDELYEYLRERRDEMFATGSENVTIDMQHLFMIFQAVCFMKQIRSIVNYEEDTEKMLKRMKSGQTAKG